MDYEGLVAWKVDLDDLPTRLRETPRAQKLVVHPLDCQNRFRKQCRSSEETSMTAAMWVLRKGEGCIMNV